MPEFSLIVLCEVYSLTITPFMVPAKRIFFAVKNSGKVFCIDELDSLSQSSPMTIPLTIQLAS